MKKLFKNISFDKMDSLNLDGFSLIDIRTPDVYKDGHIKGFVNITNNSIQSFIDKTSKDTNIIVCCYHGRKLTI